MGAGDRSPLLRALPLPPGPKPVSILKGERGVVAGTLQPLKGCVSRRRPR